MLTPRTLPIWRLMFTTALPVAAPILFLWLASPAISWWISRPLARREARFENDMADGQVTATISLDSNQKPVVGKATIEVAGLNLRQLFPPTEKMKQPLGTDQKGRSVFLKDIWPTTAEIQGVVEKSVLPEMFRAQYEHVFEGDDLWRTLPTPTGDLFAWEADSTYVKHPPYFVSMPREPKNWTLA